MLTNRLKQRKLLAKANELYGEYYKNNLKPLSELLSLAKSENYQVVVWGAGLKGQAFLSQCDPDYNFVDMIIDMDDKKQNKPLITGHMVYGIDKLKGDSLILIANANYYVSICFDLINNGYDIKKLRILCLDYYIQGQYTFSQIKDNSIWERKKYYD